MIKKTLQQFTNHEETYKAKIKENQGLSALERLVILHKINRCIYGKDVYENKNLFFPFQNGFAITIEFINSFYA